MKIKHYIVRLDAYQGDDTGIQIDCGGKDHMFIIVSVGPDGACVTDCGYRTAREARKVWSEAVCLPGETRRKPVAVNLYDARLSWKKFFYLKGKG